MLNDLHLSSLLCLATTLQGKNHYHDHFIDEETKGIEELNNLHKLVNVQCAMCSLTSKH
jgi:hypothetical protein